MSRNLPVVAVISAALSLVPQLHAQSYSIHNIGLVDWDAVLTAFYAETAEIREYSRLSEATKDELSAFDKQIRETDLRRTQAVREGDTKLAQELLDRMVSLSRERGVLAETRRRALRELLAPLSRKETYQTILRVLETVAWEKGFSHVRSIDESDLWWSQEIDITADVVNALRAKTGRQ
jgi:Skp family chaperone for outer membrane proteins